MNLEDAYPGLRVRYTPPGGRNGKPIKETDYGTVTSSNSMYVFVRFNGAPGDSNGQACYARDLTSIG